MVAKFNYFFQKFNISYKSMDFFLDYFKKSSIMAML